MDHDTLNLLKNKSFLEEYFLNNEDIAINALTIFEKDLSVELNQLSQLFSQNSFKEYRVLLHKWKPNFKIFGLDTIYHKVENLERFIKFNEEMIPKEDHNSLIELIKKGLVELNSYFKK
jgi:hypothetical protein